MQSEESYAESLPIRLLDDDRDQAENFLSDVEGQYSADLMLA